jgi:NADH:ubiquinone oxidoreductase subunit 5 (subunit L)/multisubunit Na+/H+ antiporter MnhA subunit
MNNFFILLLILTLSFGTLWAQYDSYNETEYVTDTDNIQPDSSQEAGMTAMANKYIVILICVVFMIGFYFLLLSHFPKLLDKGLSPLTAAATQCIYFSLISALIILIGVFALSGFSLSSFKQIVIDNIGFMVLILVIWFIYLIIAISNKNKGESK